MRVLVACEFSGIVRDAFLAKGHDAWSCDLLPSERTGPHIKDDVLQWINEPIQDGQKCIDCGRYSMGDECRVCGGGTIRPEWDLMIAHPPCAHLAVSGARWFETKQVEQRKAIWFFMALANANIPKIAIENPISIMSTHWRKPDQIIQPWQFGHGETKATCLWLKGLPKLKPTNIVDGREGRVWKMAPSPNRAKERSRTYTGIAEAMADQWGNL